MLSKHIREEFLAQINIAIQHMEGGWYESRVHHLEARYTLFCLKNVSKFLPKIMKKKF